MALFPRHKHPRIADKAWYALISCAVAFEFLADDKLSESTQRLCNRYPVLIRVVIFLVSGHLAHVLPAIIDVFHPGNPLHRGIIRTYHSVFDKTVTA